MSLVTLAAIMALLGSAIIAGVFFAFSSFVMKALARVPSQEGIAAMQSINVVVLTPSFLATFVGTAALSMVVAVLALLNRDTASLWFVAGAIAYVAGTFVVTAFGNVPMNDRLAEVDAGAEGARAVWQSYLVRWTRLNTVRTVAAAFATLAFAVGLAV